MNIFHILEAPLQNLVSAVPYRRVFIGNADLNFIELVPHGKTAIEMLEAVHPKRQQRRIVRPDMHQVVTERPRYGHGNRSRKWHARVDQEYDGETFVSSARRRQYGWNSKEFSDFLSPLRRYLHGQVGRPWDKVYSEIRKAIPKGLHGDHIWMHIKWEVEIHCFEQDSRVFARQRYFYGEVEVSGLYVHPRTGLLCYRPLVSRSRTEKPTAPVDRIEIDRNEEYRKISGIWYYQRFVRLDVAGPPVLKLVRKKQLNRRELRELRETRPEIVPPIEAKPVRLSR